jgi:hypothetical protein
MDNHEVPALIQWRYLHVAQEEEDGYKPCAESGSNVRIPAKVRSAYVVAVGKIENGPFQRRMDDSRIIAIETCVIRGQGPFRKHGEYFAVATLSIETFAISASY